MSRKRTRLSGPEALAQAYAAVDHAPLVEKLGVELSDDLLRLALTHRSFANENGSLPNNERLEFLGDAVLGLSVAGQLYQQYPERPESDISKMRASIVSRYGLADIARAINLGPHILLGRGEQSTDGANKDSILADTTEALLGAIYLEHGFHTARDVVLRLFRQKIDHATAQGRHQDWKTTLQERVSHRRLGLVTYQTTTSGPEHELHFFADAIVAGRIFGKGEGTNKKLAEQAAAHQAFSRLRGDINELLATLPKVDSES
ncbi:ribonuclease III [Corynebacterium poyangense]|uniref:Ribonuclease 3 n=1 Tax=Corynebacterium poyangense TaxID=2684405 RepID=A0A7H0SPM5_9CORY|nr:ribonuclease III [Corynebacterium poyangense]MBZ8178085.1 ribonuclease III [Corynebacterium poyangense]QNQ90500.1 ribonuclease III [Corynebacterium poyangense]